MPYRRPGSSIRANGNIQRFGTNRPLKNYTSLQSTTKRHQLQASLASFASILAGEYAPLPLIRFERNSGTPPAATASNNYQNTQVFNGGSVRNFKCDIYAKSLSSTTTFKIDVYAVALSFYDALVWDTVISTACPVQFSVAAGSEGEVTNKAVSATLIAPNTIANYKFVQHYMKKIGSLILAPTDSGTTTATMTLKGVPPKCRRSNLGMFYGLYFHNDSSTNAAANFTGTLEYNISFDEIPSENPMPYLW